MIELVVLAIALSLDAFAVAVGLGTKAEYSLRTMALKVGVFFGLAQGVMPAVGYFAGKGAMSAIADYMPLLAFAVLAIIGLKMIYESFSEGIEKDVSAVTTRLLLLLAFATSIDAVAAGFALSMLSVSPLVACLSIAIVTFVMSALGVWVGRGFGAALERHAERLGGIALIAVGLKLLLV